MKIGVLTFHSQLNYGGVLQCLALRNVLSRMGHEAVVVDRWMTPDNFPLDRGCDKWNWQRRLRFFARAATGGVAFAPWLRMRRTKRFVRTRLGLTPYHFHTWAEAPADLGVDMLVVGSDQVWHCGDWGDPRVYLLDGAPDVPAIAYAASFGMTELPDRLVAQSGDASRSEEVFRRGLARFRAISCREAEGVRICESLGFKAAHVVDPVLLEWDGTVAPQARSGREDVLVCYLLNARLGPCLGALQAFAEAHGCRVLAFRDGLTPQSSPRKTEPGVEALPRDLRRRFGRVRVMDDASPQDFADAFGGARWVVSDSFHALMFSIRNGCNVRMLRPDGELRRRMFSRISEIAEHAGGPLVAESVADALESFSRGEEVSFDGGWLAARRTESLAWLKGALESKG